MLQESRILDNRMLCSTVGLVTLEAPQVAPLVKPGQFIHLRLKGMDDHPLRRPYSVFQIQDGALQVMYQVVGAGSRHLSQGKVGECCDLIGPLGRGWQVPENVKDTLLVCGGLGAAPLTMLAASLADAGVSVTLVIGARDQDNLLCHQTIMDLAHEVHIATDDGSVGYHGFCTDLSFQVLSERSFDYACVCGPEPMMKLVVGQFLDSGLPCAQLSLEKRMACGIGACLSCVVETVEGKKRSCVDGPVFDAREVVW